MFFCTFLIIFRVNYLKILYLCGDKASRIITNNLMHYAIIAAGDGSRLVSDGVSVPKPLVSINGVPMIGRLLGIFARNKAESISVIVNPGMSEVKTFLDIWSDSAHLQSLGIPRFSVISEAPPSSMHSFFE